ncbi:uncharacterized skeletal organic matrix protein 8-like [Strongylocentrotus purpuratus]|uniref:Uncharacterized protein n=1 Tax=Strongylocentrotus purpuratus TaxID=7668 RepID=A0A7M7LW35_STRPU|nr:uncharacterized skeletal organic matrix protein 8-like [Strongylocentrotus purpuratus]|eukprot:XP_011672427.1 PREDICTED: uncharacterized skeletal organic matrix protein 8-like [Strongylocentrotus purpuratus]
MKTSNLHIYVTLLAGILLQYLSRWVHSASLPPVPPTSHHQPASLHTLLVSLSDSVPPTNITGTDDVRETDENDNGALHRTKRSRTRCRRQTTDALQAMLQAAGANTLYMDNSPLNFPNLLYIASNKTSKSSRRLRKREVEAVLQDGYHPDIPQELQEQLQNSYITPQQRRSSRSIRNPVGESTIGYCETMGEANDDGFLRLCGACMMTTELEDNYFPRYLNEVVCDPQATVGCLRGTGRCADRTFELSMLRRTGECAPQTSDTGGRHYVEHWEVVTRSVRVGCECELNPQSHLAAALIGS